eukprot:gene671-3971_t
MHALALGIVLVALVWPRGCSGVSHKQVLFAVNAGGPAFVSSTNVRFQSDTDDVTKAMPKGISANVDIPILRASQADQILYTTERYALETFRYQISAPKKDGDYTLVLFFSEVYFKGPNLKMFDVFLNHDLHIVKGLDIFATVGHAAAYNIFIPLSVKGNSVSAMNHKASLGGTLVLEFVKGAHDNPKVCGFALVQGSESDARSLFPLTDVDLDEIEEVDETFVEQEQLQPPAVELPTTSTKNKLRQQKRRAPQMEEDVALPMIPLFIATVAGLAILYYFCM